MRLSSRAIVTSIAACALTVGGMSAPGASAGPASSEPSAAHFIVVLHDNVDPDAAARDHGRRYGAQVERVYHNALRGYAATFKGNGAADVAHDPRVDFVELDQRVSVQGSESIPADGPWGLDRIDAPAGLDGSFSWTADGTGITAYIVDTGIETSHPEFGGRASVGKDTVGDGGGGEDCAGHGTHVAGTVGGSTYGVAKNVKLVSVRVLGCDGSGTWSGVIAGIDWVTANANRTGKAVANMSLGGGASTAVDNAVANSIKAGITYAVAAGNGNTGGVGQDACRYSPARVSTALTIGATDKTDTKSSWSNYGKCVDWFAPGVGIRSSIMGGGSEAWSGTSMATPHTTGVVALYLSTVASATPAQVQAALGAIQSTNVVKSAGKGSPTKLLYTTF